MARLTILQYPDPMLRHVCERVNHFDRNLEALTKDMLETMYLAGGRGLAAPQVGVPLQLFVMDDDGDDRDQSKQVDRREVRARQHPRRKRWVTVTRSLAGPCFRSWSAHRQTR